MPTVSIILPTYNRASYLDRCIGSVVRQTFTDWELIIVDDGSADGSKQIIDRHIAAHPRIRYIFQENQGAAFAANAGSEKALGIYVTFLDSDDEYLTDHLKLHFEYMQQHPDVDMVHGSFTVIGSPYVRDKNDLTKKIHLSQCAVGGTFFGKRKVFTGLQGFKPINYSWDSEFLERAEKRYAVVRLAFGTYVYHRDTPGSKTNTVWANTK